MCYVVVCDVTLYYAILCYALVCRVQSILCIRRGQDNSFTTITTTTTTNDNDSNNDNNNNDNNTIIIGPFCFERSILPSQRDPHDILMRL